MEQISSKDCHSVTNKSGNSWEKRVCYEQQCWPFFETSQKRQYQGPYIGVPYQNPSRVITEHCGQKFIHNNRKKVLKGRRKQQCHFFLQGDFSCSWTVDSSSNILIPSLLFTCLIIFTYIQWQSWYSVLLHTTYILEFLSLFLISLQDLWIERFGSTYSSVVSLFSQYVSQSIGMTIFLNNDQGNLLCLLSISSPSGGYGPSL